MKNILLFHIILGSATLATPVENFLYMTCGATHFHTYCRSLFFFFFLVSLALFLRVCCLRHNKPDVKLYILSHLWGNQRLQRQ